MLGVGPSGIFICIVGVHVLCTFLRILVNVFVSTDHLCTDDAATGLTGE